EGLQRVVTSAAEAQRPSGRPVVPPRGEPPQQRPTIGRTWGGFRANHHVHLVRFQERQRRVVKVQIAQVDLIADYQSAPRLQDSPLQRCAVVRRLRVKPANPRIGLRQFLQRLRSRVGGSVLGEYQLIVQPSSLERLAQLSRGRGDEGRLVVDGNDYREERRSVCNRNRCM